MQITPDGDYTQTGVEWNKYGYANPHLHQYVAGPRAVGLYYFHARTATGAEFSFPWIVAPARPTAPVAVLASNITWNAYNNFGGRSNYINPDRLPPTPTVNARLELKRYTDPDSVTYDTDDYAPLSFDRPEPINHIDARTEITDPIEGRAACHVAPAEWRLLGWLEREHFAYDYYAETQLHDGTLDLDAYKVLIISTHPEYWSRAMYSGVKSWVHERGGKLMYLGGNGLNCEAEFVDPTTVIYRNGDARDLKQGGYESRFHMRVESEANLLGVVFTETGIMTGAPFRVLERGALGFRGDRPRRRRPLRPGEPAHAMSGRGFGARNRQGLAQLAPERRTAGQGDQPRRRRRRADLSTRRPAAARFSRPARSPGPAAILVDDCVSRITANVIQRFLAGLGGGEI